MALGAGGLFLGTRLRSLTTGAWAAFAALLFLLLVVLNHFVDISYPTEDTQDGKVLPTSVRGTQAEVVRFGFVSIRLYIVAVYVTQGYCLTGFSAVVWAIGQLGAGGPHGEVADPHSG